MNTKTIFDAYSDFQASNTKANKQVLRSVMHRFLAEFWGGKSPIGVKATNEEVFNFIELMKTLCATKLIGTIEILEKEFVQKEVDKTNRKSYRSAYKAFLAWAESNEYCSPVEKQINPLDKMKLFKSHVKGSGRVKAYPNDSCNHGKTPKKTYMLMATYPSGQNKGKLIYSNDYINSTLQKELRLFEEFRKEKHGCSKTTLGLNIRYICQMLGWLHRYKNVPLENLSLNLIVTFIPLNVSISKFRDKNGRVNQQEYLNEKAIVRQETVDLANENLRLIEEYVNFVGGHPGSRLKVITVCIAIAKFMFRNAIGTDDYVDESDLAIVRRLNQLFTTINKLNKKTPDAVPHAKKSVSWKEAIDVLRILRLKADCFVREYHEIGIKEQRDVVVYKRKKSAIVNDLQDFLSLAFMILIPTDRARTYYELEIGRTLVFGILEGNRFTPASKLEDKSQAIWYIHLLPDDYKTGKIYKEYWGKIDNVVFHDGKKLYDYIDRWINEGRQYEQKCNHNLFFRGTLNYNPLNSSRWSQRIMAIFRSETGVPVTPKEIRKMYITHLCNQRVDDATLKGAAYAMHHSRGMQQNVYNTQTNLDRTQPINEYNEKMNKEFFD
ncbi:hypothetical protein LC612_41290 [Nostoc sp. CHAB 5834]|nr:hypothetical protein [Nostoc sp. CHAB 5834]